MQKLVFINNNGNEIDLTSGNFGITNWSGLSNTDLNIQTQKVPFEDGSVFLDALIEQRDIEVTVAIYDGNDLELRYQKKRELISALNPKLGEGTLIYTNNFLSKQIKAVPQIPLFENKNSNDKGTLKASVIFTCCSPYWEDLEKKEITFKIGEQPIIKNEGDVPCQIEMDWFTTFVENAKVTNVTQNQKIQVNGELTKNLIITTEVGKKSVYSNELTFNNISNTSEGFLSIAYNPNIDLYVCVSGSDVILTSSNGINWTSQVIEDINFVDYISELNIFILVGHNGKILTSPNGTTWTEQNSGTTEFLCSVAYSSELNLLVVGGANGGIYTSPDGVNWTSRNSGIQTQINSIVYSEKINLFVAVCTENFILTSSNGINWTSQTITEGSFQFESVTYSSELDLFVAVGYPGVIITSPDGINWTKYAVNITYLYSVTYSSELDLFVAVGNSILTSPDGINWTILDFNVPTNRTIKQIIYNNTKSLFVGVGNNGIVINSYNGENWEIITILSGVIQSIIYCPKYNLFVTDDGLISSDGIKWVEIENRISTKSIVWSQEKELFVAVGSRGKIYTSEDYFTWVERTGVTEKYLESVTYSSELDLFVAVGQQGIIITSPDGVNWTIQETEFIKNFSNIIYCNELNLFIISGGDIILTSSDGINWTGNTIDGDVKAVIYTKNFGLVAVGTNFIATSNNAIDWKIKTTNVSGTNISYSEKQNLFVMIGYNSYEVFTSYNLINWHSEYIGISILRCVFYSEKNDCFIIGGDYGLITHSEFLKKENMIQNLSSDSNMNLNLQVGDNQFRINNDKGYVIVRIKYRQKYIGV